MPKALALVTAKESSLKSGTGRIVERKKNVWQFDGKYSVVVATAWFSPVSLISNAHARAICPCCSKSRWSRESWSCAAAFATLVLYTAMFVPCSLRNRIRSSPSPLSFNLTKSTANVVLKCWNAGQMDRRRVEDNEVSETAVKLLRPQQKTTAVKKFCERCSWPPLAVVLSVHLMSACLPICRCVRQHFRFWFRRRPLNVPSVASVVFSLVESTTMIIAPAADTTKTTSAFFDFAAIRSLRLRLLLAFARTGLVN